MGFHNMLGISRNYTRSKQRTHSWKQDTATKVGRNPKLGTSRVLCGDICLYNRHGSRIYQPGQGCENGEPLKVPRGVDGTASGVNKENCGGFDEDTYRPLLDVGGLEMVLRSRTLL